MRLAVLASPSSWYLADLCRAAAGRHAVIAASFGQLTAGLGGGPAATAAGLDLAAVDAVLVRTMPPGSLEQVVFRMDVLARLETAGTRVVNPPKALEAAVDKYLALAKLEAAGLAVPRTIVCQTVDDAMAAFDRLGGDVVLKPLFGSEGRGIARLSDEAIAVRSFKALAQVQAVFYLQEFIPHPGHDLRVFVCGRRMLAMRRVHPTDWRTNIARGARGEAIAVTDELAELARRAADAVGASLAGVDLLPGRGRLWAIEVNAVPGWKGLSAACQTDVAAMVLEHLAE